MSKTMTQVKKDNLVLHVGRETDTFIEKTLKDTSGGTAKQKMIWL